MPVKIEPSNRLMRQGIALLKEIHGNNILAFSQDMLVSINMQMGTNHVRLLVNVREIVLLLERETKLNASLSQLNLDVSQKLRNILPRFVMTDS